MAAAKKKAASKLCVQCSRILPLSMFYTNNNWASQSYRDAWCKECAVKLVVDKMSLKQYCYENNRKWNESTWELAVKKAQYVLATNSEYINVKTTARRKDELLTRTAVRQFFTQMNLGSIYEYEDHMSGDKVSAEEWNKTPAGKTIDDHPIAADNGEEQRPEYNKKWRGRFTQEQIEALEDLYSQYEEDFVLDNVSIRDYARKVVKASQNADIAEDRMRRGECTAGEYKEAQRIFDDLSKSSNFAACKRKPGESSGLGSLGEIILRIEASGELNTNGFTFPEDDVDRIIKDFRHTLVAVGLEGQL